MIYSNTEETRAYKIRYFYDPSAGIAPVRVYLLNLPEKERAKITKYIEYLRVHDGVLDEPYTRHIKGKIRELRVDFANKRHRIFFFTFVGKNIILLHGFLKKTAQTPPKEISKAEINYHRVINNPDLYEEKEH